MQLFLLLSLAHLLGDYPFQTNWIYRQKTKSWLGSFLHVLILAACFAVLLAPYLVNRVVILALFIILVVHFFQDVWKIELANKRKKIAPFAALVLDQVLHFALLVGVAFRLDSVRLRISFAEEIITSPTFLWILMYVIVLILATFTWDVFEFVRNKREKLQHKWPSLLSRGAIVTVVFGLIYLLR